MSGGGVVDPIRVPPWMQARVARAWRETPPIARIFIGLTVLDVVGRAFGLLEPGFDGAFRDPLALFAAFLPHDLWILLPAILILRRPDAVAAGPQVVWGAIGLAAVELIERPARALLGLSGSVDAVAAAEWVVIAASVALVAGRIVLGRGLASLNPRTTTPFVEGLANLVVLGVVLQALILGSQLIGSPADLGDAGLNALVTWGGFASIVAILAWGYVLRTIVRAIGDERRSTWATAIAAGGATLSSGFGLILAIVSVAYQTIGPFSGIEGVVNGVSWTEVVFAPTLVLAGFVMGLAEPSVPYLAPRPSGGAANLRAPDLGASSLAARIEAATDPEAAAKTDAEPPAEAPATT